MWFLYKNDLCISTAGKHELELSEINKSRKKNTDNGFKGTVVNRALPSFQKRLLEITLTVPVSWVKPKAKTLRHFKVDPVLKIDAQFVLLLGLLCVESRQVEYVSFMFPIT